MWSDLSCIMLCLPRWSKRCPISPQLISDKKALNERCESVVGELKEVDQKYTNKIAKMQEQHEMVSHGNREDLCMCKVSLQTTTFALHLA